MSAYFIIWTGIICQIRDFDLLVQKDFNISGYKFLLEPLCWGMPAWLQPNKESEDSIPPQPPYMFTPIKQYDLS